MSRIHADAVKAVSELVLTLELELIIVNIRV